MSNMQGEAASEDGSAEEMAAKPCVYWIRAPSGYVKIGIAKNPWARLKELQTGHHERLEMYCATDCEADGVLAIDYERALHEFLAPLRVQGEWFKFDARAFAIAERLAWHKLRCPQMWDRWWRADHTMVVKAVA
jgi:hypothetical protein